MNPLDRAVNNDFIIISKSLLPYLSLDKQKTAAILIKAVELIYTINTFSNESYVRSISRSPHTGWEKEFLQDVKNNLTSDKAYVIDAILKISEARDLLKTQTSSNASEEPRYTLNENDSGILESSPFPPATTESAEPSETTSMPSPDQLINGLSSLLDPKQAQLLKALSTLFKPNS